MGLVNGGEINSSGALSAIGWKDDIKYDGNEPELDAAARMADGGELGGAALKMANGGEIALTKENEALMIENQKNKLISEGNYYKNVNALNSKYTRKKDGGKSKA